MWMLTLNVRECQVSAIADDITLLLVGLGDIRMAKKKNSITIYNYAL